MPSAQDRSPAGAATLANWRSTPTSRWAFAHVRDLMPVADIFAGRAAWDLPEDPHPLADFSLKLPDGKALDLAAVLRATATDALAVLHQGRLVFEHYTGAMTAATPHIIMSATKSIVGLIAGILAARSEIDLGAPVSTYVPEVRGTAFGNASLRQLLDMRAGVRFSPAEQRDYANATGWEPPPTGAPSSGLHGFFTHSRTQARPHGGPFAYVSANTDLLGWAIERATGATFAELVAKLLWQPMGAESDAYITVSADGAPRCTGGMCATLRDLARVGQLIADGGRRGTTPIIPAALIDDIATNGDREAWKAGEFAAGFGGAQMSYRSGWYVMHGERELLFAMGIHGQNLFIDRANRLVIAKLSSQGEPSDPRAIGLTHRAVAELRRCLTAAS